MERILTEEVRRFIRESTANRLPESDVPYFVEPLVGFAAAGDPIFDDYKRIIGPFHRRPAEILAEARSVVVWVLPFSPPVREANRHETALPAREWALGRFHGEQLNGHLRRHVTGVLQRGGHQAVAPQLDPDWQEFADTPVGIASTWSERHAAYAAGLGTFSLSDGLITAAGIAHRLGSVITDLALTPTPRPYRDHRAYCLYCRDGSCGACMARCPAGAITRDGHDKTACRGLVYGEAPRLRSEAYGVPQTGCGLCQTKVPCESRIPGKTAAMSLG